MVSIMREKLIKILNNMNIKNKLILTYLIVAITTVSVVGSYLTNKITEVVVNQAISEAENNANTMQYRVEEVIRLTTRVSELIYSDEKLNEMISKQYDNTADVVSAYSNHSILGNYVKYYKEFSSINLYVDNDTLLENTEISKVTSYIENQDWYRNAISDNGKVSWIYKKDDLSGIQYLCLVRAIKDTNGNITGVLTINISPSILKAIAKAENQNNIIDVDNQTVSLAKNYKISKEDLIGTKIKSSEDGMDNVIKTNFNEEKSYVIQKKFKIEKAPSNDFEILIVLPISNITSQTNKVILNSIGVILGTILLSLGIIIYFSKLLSNRINILRNEMRRVVNGDLDIKKKITGNDEIGQLYQDLSTMMESIKNLINEVYVQKIQQEKLKLNQKEIEFKMLASQINPHFLYNTLETIRMKAVCNDEREIANIVKKLGKLLRRNLEVSGKSVSLESELEMMKNYLEIQAMRFEGMVTYNVDISEDISISNYIMLPLLLQPIVENAFIHGLEEKNDKGNININIVKKNKYLTIRVSDNGVGIEEDKLKELKNELIIANEESKSIGMNNVNQRIKIYYGDDYGLDIDSILGKGTTVTINLPIEGTRGR